MNAHARIITDDSLENALNWLRDHAAALGRAKARAIKAEHMVKHIEALEMKRSDAKSNDMKKADARISAAYLAAILEDAEAAGEYERLKAMREAAALKIEAWRSEQANYRAMKL